MFIRWPEPLRWPIAISLRSSSCVNSFTLLQSQLFTIFSLNHLFGREFSITKFMALPSPKTNRWDQICNKRLNFNIFFLYSHTPTWEKKWIHGFDAHKALYQNCEIYNPRDMGSGTRVGPIILYTLKYLPPFYSRPFLILLSVSDVKTGQILMTQINFL